MEAVTPTPELVTVDKLDAAMSILRSEMHSMEVRMIKWQIGSVAGIVAIAVAFLRLTA